MSTRSKTPSNHDPYCHVCSSTSGTTKRLSSYSCDHCHLLMCYDCFNKHISTLNKDSSPLHDRFSQLTNVFQDKKQLFASFKEHCLRTVNSAFDEIIHDLENLRKESINYVNEEFRESELVLSNMINNLKPLISKSSGHSSSEDLTNNVMNKIDIQHQEIETIEKRLEIFSSPTMRLKIFTFPRNQFNLQCQLFSNSYRSTKRFAASYPGKRITTKCTCAQKTEHLSEKIDVDTEVEELSLISYSTKQTQTDLPLESTLITHDDDEDEFYSIQEETSELSHRMNAEHLLSTQYHSQGTILTQNEVDRIASDGEHLLYFSETSQSICYVRSTLSDRQTNGIAMTKEITCRWPHHPILDLVYSPVSSQFICATKTGVYTCTIDSNNENSTIDIQMQLTQHWSYIRLSTDKDYLWLWTDTPRLSQLCIYSPKTFDCIKSFKLTDYPRFSDNSTSFCIQTNLLATVFQYKQSINSSTYKKYFHVTLCDSTNLHELCTIPLGECDIDHEIRANYDGKFFLTNGKRKLWIIDRTGKKEYVKLFHTGRALTIHKTNQIIIANGTQRLQCIERL